MLQSRPITNLDNNFTEFEIAHEMDTGFPAEREYITKANVGEVFPGSTSTLVLSYLLQQFLNVEFFVSYDLLCFYHSEFFFKNRNTFIELRVCHLSFTIHWLYWNLFTFLSMYFSTLSG